MRTLDHVEDPIHLLDIAIRDVESFKKRAETDPSLEFCVDSWHRIRQDVCYACVAGSVMAGELRVPDRASVKPSHFGFRTSHQLRLLDQIRCGDTFEMSKTLARLRWAGRWCDALKAAKACLNIPCSGALYDGEVHAFKTYRDCLIAQADAAALPYERLKAE